MTMTTIRVENSPSRDESSGAAPAAEPMVTRRATRRKGALIAGGIAIVVAIPGSLVFEFMPFGVPAAALVGARLGPSIRDRGDVAMPAAGMATVTILVAEVITLAAMVVPSAFTPTERLEVGPTIVGLVLIGVYGLGFVGVPMLVVTVPCAIAWALGVRELVRRGHGAAIASEGAA